VNIYIAHYHFKEIVNDCPDIKFPSSLSTLHLAEWGGYWHCWKAGSVESSSMVWTCVPNGRFPPAKIVLIGGASGWLALPTQCTKETMEKSGHCQHDNSSSQASSPWSHDGKCQHGTRQGCSKTWRASTDAMTNQVSMHIQMSRALLDKRWSNPHAEHMLKSLLSLVKQKLNTCKSGPPWCSTKLFQFSQWQS